MRKLLLLVLIFLLWATTVHAATYYLATTGGDAGHTGATGDPWATFAYAFGQMSGGDTLIVKDGTYDQVMRDPPSGSAGAYTIVKAEHDGLAILQITTSAYMLFLVGRSYVQVEGFKFINNAVNATHDVVFFTTETHHCKLLRSACFKNPTTTEINCANVTVSGTYNLIEDVWTWGGGRYKFIVYGGDNQNSGSHNIFRRCVARHDREYSGGYNPSACFSNYYGHDTLFQNCIAIDSSFPPSRFDAGYDAEPYYDSWIGPWFMPNEAKGGIVKLEGCIAINYSGTFVSDESNYNDSDPMLTAGNLTFSNCVAIDGWHGIRMPYAHSNRTVAVDHCVFSQLSGEAYWSATDLGWGFVGGPSHTDLATATNSIFYSLTYANGGGLQNAGGANNYNCFYGNTANRLNSDAGANDITATNPAASLLYPMRIETGSALKGAGSSGSDIGPTILYRMGTSGTLYGETGYDTLTDIGLWPFPNEARIYADMRVYGSNWPSGNLPSPTRGFCASGETLTHYIANYLGNGDPFSSVTISTTSLPAGQVSVAYNQTVSATGGVTPYDWTISSGALPTGLSIANTTGIISGTPSVATAFAFNVTCTDSQDEADTAALSMSITVAPEDPVVPENVTAVPFIRGKFLLRGKYKW